MISARDELLYLLDCLSDAECERALDLLAPLSGRPHCPGCGQTDLDLLEWQDEVEGELVCCQTCGFVWDPNHNGPLSLKAEAPCSSNPCSLS